MVSPSTARRANLSKLGKYWVIVVFWWLIVHVITGDLAALTLFYMVLHDFFKEQE